MWWLVYTAKVRRATTPAPPVNLVGGRSRGEAAIRCWRCLQSPADREFAAKRIFDMLADHEGSLPNTGALARIRVPRAELIGNKQLDELRKRAEDAKGDTIPLFTPAEFAQIKPQIAVRSIDDVPPRFSDLGRSDSGGISADAYCLDACAASQARGHSCRCC